MKKRFCLCLALLCLGLPLGVCAQDLPSPDTIAAFSGALPEALRPAFAASEWANWNVETGRWRSNWDGSAVHAYLVMQSGQRRALCAVVLKNGEPANFVSGEAALYLGRIPDLESGERGDGSFKVVYSNADGTTEKFSWFFGSDDNWHADGYFVMQGEQVLRYVGISPRTLQFDEEPAVFNTQPWLLQGFDAVAFPKTIAQARALAVHSPLAAADTALTRHFFDGGDTTVPLRERAADAAPVLMHYYDGVAAEVLPGGDDGWAHLRIGNLVGYMRREHLAFGPDKAQVYPWEGDPGRIEVPFPATSLTLREHPAAAAPALGEVGLYEYVRVLGYTPDLQWVQVRDTREFSAYAQPPQGAVGFMPAIYVPKTDNMRSAYIRSPDPKSRLNLRAGPRKEAESLGKYYSGLEVIFLHGSANEDAWRRVVIDGVVGYMDAAYLDFSSGDLHLPHLPPLATVDVPGSGAALYADAALAENPIGVYPSGSMVEVLGVTGRWGHVRTPDGGSGYMRLEEIGGEPASAMSAQMETRGEVPLYSAPSESAESKAVLPLGTAIQLYGHGHDHWLRTYDYQTDTFGPLELVDHDWVFVMAVDGGAAGYARWSQLNPD